MSGLSPTPAVWFPTVQAGTGSDVFTRRLCDALKARGIHAEITWIPHRAEYLPWTVPVPQAPECANIVHANSWLPDRFRGNGLPTVVTVHHLVHDPEYHAYRSFLQAAYHQAIIRPRELRAIRRADAVTTVSDYVRQTVLDFSRRQDVEVIHNWIDSDRFAPVDERGEPGCSNLLRLFMAGSHSRRKGFDLLPAFAAAMGPQCQIRYAGGNSSQAGVAPNVVELGRISEDALVWEYQSCDAVVSLSRYEGFGYTALEAMACEKPFFGFRTSAVPEVVTPLDGVLVSNGDVTALAEAVTTWVARRGSGAALGTQGRERVSRLFSDVNVDRYVDVYERLLKSPSSSRGNAHG